MWIIQQKAQNQANELYKLCMKDHFESDYERGNLKENTRMIADALGCLFQVRGKQTTKGISKSLDLKSNFSYTSGWSRLLF